MRGKERELIVLRSENGETWKEHQFDSKNEDLTELLNGMDEGNYDSCLFCKCLQAELKGMTKGSSTSVSHVCTLSWESGSSAFIAVFFL